MRLCLSEIVSQDSFFVIAGPCVIESLELTRHIAVSVKSICKKLDLPVIFKASFDKANRTSASSFRGVGINEGLNILASIKEELDIPVLTDIHNAQQAQQVAEVCDVLQIPAFLCRQTDLVEAAASTGRIVNIKKGQFVSPEASKHLVDKVKAVSESCQVALTERGYSFGYGNLVVDMRSFPIMKQWSDAVIYDATHSLQLPASSAPVTGGQAEFIPALACAAMATGSVDGIFLETHPEPEKSPSDAGNILDLQKFETLLNKLIKVKAAVKAK